MRWLLPALLVCVAGAGTWAVTARRAHSPTVPSAPRRTSDVRVPSDARIRVQVLNASRTPGLARDATIHLRRLGFDVVEYGNAGAGAHDSTVVLDRSGHTAWAGLVARAMGGAPVAARPDSSRYLDVTVLVGSGWHAPADPFHP